MWLLSLWSSSLKWRMLPRLAYLVEHLGPAFSYGFVWTIMKHEVMGDQGWSHRGNEVCEAMLFQTLILLKR